VSSSPLLESDVFAKYCLPTNPGNQFHFNHADCPAGVDLKQRLYIKHTEDGKMWVAWCHHCGRKRAKPITGLSVPSPMMPAPAGVSSYDVQQSLERKPYDAGDPFLEPFLSFFEERLVTKNMLSMWMKEHIFPRHLRCGLDGRLRLVMRKNIICEGDEMLRNIEVGEQIRFLYTHGGPKYLTTWDLPQEIRDRVQMTPCIIPPICLPMKVQHHRLVFTEDLITALRFARAGVNALPCGGAGNLTDNLLWRTAQDYPAITEVAFAFDNDGSAIFRTQEKAFVTAELLFADVVYQSKWRYDRLDAMNALVHWGWA